MATDLGLLNQNKSNRRLIIELHFPLQWWFSGWATVAANNTLTIDLISTLWAFNQHGRWRQRSSHPSLREVVCSSRRGFVVHSVSVWSKFFIEGGFRISSEIDKIVRRLSHWWTPMSDGQTKLGRHLEAATTTTATWATTSVLTTPWTTTATWATTSALTTQWTTTALTATTTTAWAAATEWPATTSALTTALATTALATAASAMN